MTPADLLVLLGMALAVYVPKALPLVVVSESLTRRMVPALAAGLVTIAVVTVVNGLS